MLFKSIFGLLKRDDPEERCQELYRQLFEVRRRRIAEVIPLFADGKHFLAARRQAKIDKQARKIEKKIVRLIKKFPQLQG